MTSGDALLLAVAAVLIVVAGVIVGGEAALASYSKARADQLVSDGRAGAARLRALLDDPPRYLNTALLLRLGCEITAIVLVTKVVSDVLDPTWAQVLVAAGGMLVISYVVVGVAPRQHQDAGPGPGHHGGVPGGPQPVDQGDRLRHRGRALPLVQPVLGGLEQQRGLGGEGVHQQRRTGGVERGVAVRHRGRQQRARQVRREGAPGH